MYMTREQVEEHYDACRRREARVKRYEAQEARKGRYWQVFGFFLLLMAAAGIIIGGCVLGSAERDRLHGWRQTTCIVSRNYAAHNVTEFANVCVYFSVNVHGSNETLEWCAVPASIAGRGHLADPPACSDLSSHDRLDIDYWRIVSGSVTVECLVPKDSMIPADRCVAAATTGGPGPAIWRTWLDRFIYLVRDPREATEAVYVATQVQRTTGIVLIAVGCVIFIPALCFLFFKHLKMLCTTIQESSLNLRRSRRQRFEQEHKLS